MSGRFPGTRSETSTLNLASRSLAFSPARSTRVPAARPEWRGEDPLTESYRLMRRRRVKLEKMIGADDVFLVPDIFRDRRRDALPAFLKQTGARSIAIFHDATDLRLTDIYPEREKK